MRACQRFMMRASRASRTSLISRTSRSHVSTEPRSRPATPVRMSGIEARMEIMSMANHEVR
jgi:hypothetical protein